ncbi:MAG TPA: hypothetical protein VM580_04690 [Labilithrix sp.]|nr:hypothetical protein [Labilithrix sp.]
MAEKEGEAMRWDKPEMIEIKMDAEISSYQDDSHDPRKERPAFLDHEPSMEPTGAVAVSGSASPLTTGS